MIHDPDLLDQLDALPKERHYRRAGRVHGYKRYDGTDTYNAYWSAGGT